MRMTATNANEVSLLRKLLLTNAESSLSVFEYKDAWLSSSMSSILQVTSSRYLTL